MFSEASVNHSVHRAGESPGWRPPSLLDGDIPLLLTSSGSHCSGRYAFYWNAFSCRIKFIVVHCFHLLFQKPLKFGNEIKDCSDHLFLTGFEETWLSFVFLDFFNNCLSTVNFDLSLESLKFDVEKIVCIISQTYV